MRAGEQTGWWLMALLCMPGAARAQASAVIRTETRVVLMDTIVTNKQGEYVHGLTAKDFHLWDDNKQQTILSVSPERGPATSRPRYLVLFFGPMEAAERIVARQAVSGFIDANAEENRRVAVVSYGGGLRIAQAFTDDAGRLKAAVNTAISSGTDSEAVDTIRTLGNLARNLGALPGRKIVVFVSGGLSQSSSIQRAELTAVIEACNRSDVAVYPIDLRPLGSETTPHNQGQVLGSFENAERRAGLGESIGAGRQAEDGLQGQKGDSDANLQGAGVPNQQLLFRLASGTGGFVIANSSELQRGLQKIGEEQSEYYVLSYTPSESKAGSCHTLRVKVDRSGTTVRARADYCESKPQDLLAGTATGRDLERRAAGTQTGMIGASVQLAQFYLSPGVARVNLAMEIPPDALKFQNPKGKTRSSYAELNLLGIASAPDGVAGARFSDALKLDSENQGKPLHYEREFKIVPGQYSFTMTFNSGGESFGKLEIPLVVEPRQAGELGLSGLVLSKETHPAAELGLGGVFDQSSHTPLVANDVQVVPSGSNQFNKSEMGFVYFEVYARDPASVRVGVRVLDRKSGELKSDSGRLQLGAPIDGGGIPVGSRVPIGTLGAGSYELEVTAVDAGGKPVRRTVDFDVK
jgi:VWFA-related protein